MTLREALAVQERHLNAFASQLAYEQARKLRQEVSERTLIFPSDNLDEQLPIWRINELVPRGTKIEHLFNAMRSN